MRENARQIGAALRRTVYPPVAPFHQMMMDVGDGHRIYVEQCGNPDGVPVLVLHGGPGGGCYPGMRRFFDPDHYRIVLFDQRGCGRSTPHASVEHNTTWDLVTDIEEIRAALRIDAWLLFGGSWGSTLALLYAQAHPDHVLALALRGIFTMTQAELDWFYGGGAGRFFPEAWARFIAPIPEQERGDLIAAYHARLFGDDPRELMRCATTWSAWESALAVLEGEGRTAGPGGDYARAFARLENHYFTHNGWLEEDGQILRDMDRIAHLPGHIVQGRYDMICPPATAVTLADRWPAARLHMVGAAGHALSEPGITAALVAAMEELKGVAERG
ncbi:prolyl aminopeptidase [Oceanomicrobium pacificus]|uniref:Proline iminopeptidase n=1 Tax=Oceanomicrobium pacificus TaxID=2692916 RepID=A0A6B0TLI6_9RHOB|nr:prolyl aminopeptidase [Oceanomicrobium pacificus]MXU64756.1 prolyl aminopeptidase [Oceanomicrobium pacificus]